MAKTRSEQIELRISNDDEVVAYLVLPDHPEKGAIVKKTVRLREVLGNYEGPDLFFDFDENNVLIGVEIID